MEQWLSSIGLQERVAAFQAQGISLDQLTELTDADLRELGLTIGERKRFRRAVAARQDAVPTRPERRPLTTMFVDIIDSSALGERLEPEDLLEVIQHYREFCGAAITQYGGHIARFVGDGILAYFCYPIANENDPERAVRAALDITRGITGLVTASGDALSVRIGIATGRVIVSDVFAGGEDRRSTIGSTPNLAARLQGLAPPNGIIIANETHERVAALFACENLGEQDMRGFEARHRPWRVLGEATRASSERRPRRLTTFYDREDEFRLLADHWSRAKQGYGSAVLVTGEPGIGKSRLVKQFLATESDSTVRIIQLAGSPFGQDSPLHPVITFLRNAARLDPNAPHAAQMIQLRSVLAGTTAQQLSVLPLFGELVGVGPEDSDIQSLAPDILRERLLSALLEQLLLWADAAPLLLLVEDLHWLDPTSRELLERMADSLAKRKILLLLTIREGYEMPLVAERATRLHLARLPVDAVTEMVQSLFGDRLIPPQLPGIIARRTDGVPLFIEAVTRSLLQLPSLPEFDEGPFDVPDPSIPASLHESLMARLDRSGAAKTIAQIAAVVGRSVRSDVLAATARVPDNELEHALTTLAEADVLYPDDTEAAGTYTFTHALLRDAAYDSLLRDDRRDLHVRVARALQQLDPHTVEQQPELLALHLTEGSLVEEAVQHWLEAARRSLARSALTEATRLLRRGLAGLERLSPNHTNIDLRLQLSVLLGPALIGLKGPASAEAQELYATAYSMCRELAEEPSHFPVYWGWWRVSQDYHGQIARSRVVLERAIELHHPEFMLQAHHCNWAAHYHAGDFAHCLEHIDAGLSIYENGDYSHHAPLYGNHDPKVCALGERAQLRWMQGRLVSAMRDERASVLWAERLDHLGSRVHAMDFGLLHRVYRREYQEVFERAGKLVLLTSEHQLDDHRGKGLVFRGWTVAMQGDPFSGLQTLQEGLSRQRDTNTSDDFPIYICLLAETLAACGRPDQAVEELTKAHAEFDKLGLRIWQSEVLRMLGEMTMAADPGKASEAELLFAQAAVATERHGAAMLGLRVAVSQAVLYAGQGRRSAAQRVLRQAIVRITEPDDSADFITAKQLAAQLANGEDTANARPTVAVP